MIAQRIFNPNDLEHLLILLYEQSKWTYGPMDDLERKIGKQVPAGMKYLGEQFTEIYTQKKDSYSVSLVLLRVGLAVGKLGANAFTDAPVSAIEQLTNILLKNHSSGENKEFLTKLQSDILAYIFQAGLHSKLFCIDRSSILHRLKNLSNPIRASICKAYPSQFLISQLNPSGVNLGLNSAKNRYECPRDLMH
jgi:hypothetical protein